MTDDPPPIPPTTAEEGVRTWDAAITTANARMSAARLQYGYALLRLHDDVGGGNKAFGNKLQELGLKASKDVQADAQKVAKAVQSGDMTEEQALGLTAREIRLLSHTVREDGIEGWHVRTPKPKASKKPKPEAPKEPDLFDTPAPGDTAIPATGDDVSRTVDQNEAASTAPLEDPSDDSDNASGIEQGSDVGDVLAGIVGEDAGVVDGGGGAKQVEGAAYSSVATTIIIPRPRLTHLLAIAREAVGARTWRKHKTWEAIIADAEQDIIDDKDSSGHSARQRALAEIGQTLEALLTS